MPPRVCSRSSSGAKPGSRAARTGYARPSRCGRASHGPLQEQCARSRVQPFRGARAGEGAGNRRVRRPRRRVGTPDARRGVEAGRGTGRRVIRGCPTEIRRRSIRRPTRCRCPSRSRSHCGPGGRASGSGSGSTRTSAACLRRRWWRGRSTNCRLGANPPVFLYMAGPVMANILYHIGNEQQRHWAQLAIERNWAATMVLTEPDAGSDVGAGRTKAVQAGRRHLAHRRRQAVHHQRRHRRCVREHPAPGARATRGRRAGNQGTEPVPGSRSTCPTRRPASPESATGSSSPASSTRWG